MSAQTGPERDGQVVALDLPPLDSSTKNKWSVNRKLLPLKLYFFFFYGASGSFIPFITVYLKYLGLSAAETGLVTGLSMLVAMVIRAVIGLLADRLSATRTALLICCLGFGLSFSCMYFLPRRAVSHNSINITTNEVLPQSSSAEEIGLWICTAEDGREICRYPACADIHSCKIFERTTLSEDTKLFTSNPLSAYMTLDELGPSLDRNTGLYLNRASKYVYNLQPCFYVNDQTAATTKIESNYQRTGSFDLQNDDHNTGSFTTGNSDENIDSFDSRNNIQNIASFGEIRTDGNKSSLNSFAGSSQVEKAVTRNHVTSTANMSDNMEIRFQCLPNCVQYLTKVDSDSTTDSAVRLTRRLPETVTPDLVMSLCFLLLTAGKSFYSASTSLVDAVTYTILGPYSLKWGQQRLWGTIGTSAVALTVTLVNDSRQVNSFTELFVACMGFSCLAFLTGFFKLKADRSPRSRTIFHDICRLLRRAAVRLFLCKLLLYGLLAGTSQNFIFWFLVDLGSGQLTLGVCLFLYCVSSVVILRCSRLVLHTLGQTKVMYLALLAYSIRYLALSFLTDAWQVLPAEALHGITYSLFWAAASSTASIVAPPGTQASSQGLAGAMYWDLGRGLGIIISGQLVQVFGARWTFRSYSLVCVVVLPVVWLLDRKWPLGSSDTAGKSQENTAPNQEEKGQLLKSSTEIMSNSRNAAEKVLVQKSHLELSENVLSSYLTIAQIRNTQQTLVTAGNDTERQQNSSIHEQTEVVDLVKHVNQKKPISVTEEQRISRLGLEKQLISSVALDNTEDNFSETRISDVATTTE